uniref:Secreted protein n=1 Tax=Ananas comosus var. bracteatus TaxID=296719 RepID=A0A6V7QCA0_ANACO|nr:unnamed protein product [Ananas comosus var. bracteatus]
MIPHASPLVVFALFCLLEHFPPLLEAWILERSSLERRTSTLVGLGPCWELLKRHDDWTIEVLTILACHLCSYAHACEGRSPQAGTPELAYATYVRPCGIE